jgi:hypothetical protein
VAFAKASHRHLRRLRTDLGLARDRRSHALVGYSRLACACLEGRRPGTPNEIHKRRAESPPFSLRTFPAILAAMIIFLVILKSLLLALFQPMIENYT